MSNIEREIALTIIEKINKYFDTKTIKKDKLVSYLEREYKICHQTLREFIELAQKKQTIDQPITFNFSLSDFTCGRMICVKSIENFETYLKSELLDEYVVIGYRLCFSGDYYLQLEKIDLAIKCQEKEGK